MSEVVAIDQSNKAQWRLGLTAGITLETALYSLVFVIGAALRWIHLGLAPLSSTEASQALAAWQNAPLPAGGSLVLYSFNQLALNIFGSSLGDAGPRIGAALIGTVMILLPLLYRDRVGRVGALAASLMLAISPTAVFASRTIDGTIAVVACALAALGFGLRFIRLRRSIDLIGLAISIGLGITGGPGSVTLVIVIGLGSVIVLRWIPSSESTEIRSLRQFIQSDQIRRALWWGGAVFVLVATVMLMNPAAIRFVPETFSAWLNSFRTVQGTSAARLFESLLLYEPLIVLAGVAGLFAVLFRADGTSVLLGLWSLGSLMIILLQPGRQILAALLVLAPLTLLAGMLVQQLITALQRHGSWAREGAVWLIGAPLVIYLILTAANTAVSRQVVGGADSGSPWSPLLSFVMTAGILLLLLGVVFVITLGVATLLRAAAAGALVLLVMISLSSAWSLNHLNAGDPHELMWGPVATTRDAYALVSALHAASDRLTGDPNQISINVVSLQPNPVVQWYLHDFKRVTINAAPDLSAQAIVAPTAISSTISFIGYAGSAFDLQSIWSPESLAPSDVMRWWLYRAADTPAAFENVSVWVKVNSQ